MRRALTELGFGKELEEMLLAVAPDRQVNDRIRRDAAHSAKCCMATKNLTEGAVQKLVVRPLPELEIQRVKADHYLIRRCNLVRDDRP